MECEQPILRESSSSGSETVKILYCVWIFSQMKTHWENIYKKNVNLWIRALILSGIIRYENENENYYFSCSI